MRTKHHIPSRIDGLKDAGRAGLALIMFLLGAPLSVVLLAFLVRGCAG